MPQRLTLEEVRHVARLARLELSEDQLQAYRDQLSAVLQHVARLAELDLEHVAPMAHPGDLVNRLAEDVVAPSLPVEVLLRNAPATEGDYLAVPKVLV